MLNKVNMPSDVKKLNYAEKKELANDIREEILNVVSKNGGHLASNLGIVELTIALISYFNVEKDRVVFDVGHQSYVYKLLTGRKDRFKTLRKFGGLAGFPRTDESKFDYFDTGHSSTSISAALGMARARDLLNKKYNVIAVIGDGALTGGMALEALNDAGISRSRLIVILNDNEMSISKNTGGLSRFLTKLRTKRVYVASNKKIKKLVNKIPLIGKRLSKRIGKIKNGIKEMIIPKMYFENIGFTYLGPVDGHNIEAMEDIFKRTENIDGPILIHVLTKKGKGYSFAEEEPNKYHATGAFDLSVGKQSSGKLDYSAVMGNKLVKLAHDDKRIVAVTAAMEEGTGLSSFAKKYPKRFFDVEIAEQHGLTMVAGMAREGLKPVIPIYSSFLQRGYDQVVHDICLQKLGVVICVDRAGCVGADGETHNGLLDLSYLRTIPNMTVMAPKDFVELEDMLEFACKFDKPIAIRYPRGGEGNYKYSKHNKIVLGKSEVLKEGNDITIIGIGKMTERAIEVSELLEKDGLSVEVINARFAKPIDIKTITESSKKTGIIVTIEDNNISGGFGEGVKANIRDCKVLSFGYPDKFIKHGNVSELEGKYGLDKDSIYKKIKEII